MQTNKSTFLSHWLRTLVERQATLQYQHNFTNALLNADPENPILQNLPFVRTEASGYRITLSEFQDRRLSLIGSMFTELPSMVIPILIHSYSKLY